jgi:hypothetical protein
MRRRAVVTLGEQGLQKRLTPLLVARRRVHLSSFFFLLIVFDCIKLKKNLFRNLLGPIKYGQITFIVRALGAKILHNFIHTFSDFG